MNEMNDTNASIQPGAAQSAVQQNTELTERQKNILRSKGISDEYSELTDYEKRTINDIEEMLVYAEEKYQIRLSFAEYREKTTADGGILTAYPTAGDKATDCFDIERREENGEWVYSDDYMTVAVRDLYVQYLSEGLRSVNADMKFTLVADISEADLTEVPADASGLKGKVAATNAVFIAPDGMGDGAYEKLFADYESWLNAEQAFGVYHMILLNDDLTGEITAANYEDYLEDAYYSRREKIYVN